MEWQDHRYDPGSFLGGRIHPILLAPRPNKFGYLLVILGSAYFLQPILLVSADPPPILDWKFSGDTLVALILLLMLEGFGAVQLAAGFKLLQKPRFQASSPQYEDEPLGEPWWEAAGPEALPQPSTARKSRKPYTRKMVKRS